MLKTYIGVKIVQAEPSTCPKPMGKSKVGDPGYRVVYEDGYVSWSPKKAFEDANRLTDGMTFGLAVEAMRKGLKVRLPDWREGRFVMFEINERGEAYFFDSITRMQWRPGVDEILQDKWQIVD